MGDILRYAKVVTVLGFALAGTAIGVKNSVHWLSSGPRISAAEDRHLRLSVE